MARPLRLELAGGFYHVTSRGDRREDIFFTQHANRTHGRVGHVFQGRYKAILVEKEAFLLELARYVVLNPVRARMVADAAEWPWSSYRSMTGQAPTPPWLQTDALLAKFGLQRDQAVMRFIDFVRAGVDQPPLWDKLRGQIYLGDDAFLEKMSALANDTIQEIPLIQRRPVARDLHAYTQNPGHRDAAMAQAFATGAFTMRAIADAFGVHYATVSRAVSKEKK